MPRGSRTTAEDACLAFEKVNQRLYDEAVRRWKPWIDAAVQTAGDPWLPVCVDTHVINAGVDSDYAVEVSLVIDRKGIDSVVGKGDTLYLATREAFRALRDPSTLPKR